MYEAVPHRYKNDRTVWVREEENSEGERGGLLTRLKWLFCSCAIICGGVLRAMLQHHTAPHTSAEVLSTVT